MTELRVVVGSGPSGVSVTHALLNRGLQVLMLDVGKTLDDSTTRLVRAMAGQEPNEWSESTRRSIQQSSFGAESSLPPKRLFGSSIPYFVDPKIEARDDIRLYGSQALGGLSTVWGCALLKAGSGDTSDWPTDVRVGIENAYPSIGALVQRFTGADIFEAGTHLKMSPAAETMLRRFRKQSLGSSTLDMFPTPLAISRACKACNACMYGCVYGFTYSSRWTVENDFLKNPRFRYIGDVTVERFQETAAGVVIHTVAGVDRRAINFTAKQLFVAAGMMGSLRILWNSSPHIGRVLYACDLSSFLIPAVFPSAQGLRKAKHHGLSQLSGDLKASPFQNKPAHFQLYFNNPAVSDGLMDQLGPFASRAIPKVVRFANRFLIAAQGYLHSDFCHRLRLEWCPTGAINASVAYNYENAKAVNIALSHLSNEMRSLGAIFVKRAAKITPYGSSRMVGALPHALEAGPSTTDQFGRPAGSKDVFIVDATVLPSISGRNQTLPMMANALRIGQLA